MDAEAEKIDIPGIEIPLGIHIDDNQNILTVTKPIFESVGLESASIQKWDELVALVKLARAQARRVLIVTDLKMKKDGNVDGDSVAKWTKTIDYRIPVIIYSADPFAAGMIRIAMVSEASRARKKIGFLEVVDKADDDKLFQFLRAFKANIL